MKNGTNPIEDLGKLMDSQMKKVAGANKGIAVELGKINANMSLSVGSLANAIPKGDYMVSLRLTISSLELDTSMTSLETSNENMETGESEGHKHTISGHSHSVDGHKHTVTLPSQLRSIQPGDRVLVAWVGTEPIVVDIVVSS